MSTNIVIFFMNPSYFKREFSKNISEDVSIRSFLYNSLHSQCVLLTKNFVTTQSFFY